THLAHKSRFAFDSGVVENHGGRAHLPHGGFDHLARVGFHRHVGPNRDRLPADAFDLFDGISRSFLVEVNRGNFCPLARKQERRRPPHSRTRAGDECDLSLELHAVSSLDGRGTRTSLPRACGTFVMSPLRSITDTDRKLNWIRNMEDSNFIADLKLDFD